MKLMAKMGYQGSRNMLLGCAFAACLCLAGSPLFADEAQGTPPNVLPWISDVVKMSDAGIPPDVIANYIKNTSAHSTLSADDIIYLRDHKIPSNLITAMIEHGSVAQTEYAAQAAPPPQAPPAYAPAPAYAQSPPPQYYQPPVTYVDQQPATVYYNYSYPDYGYNYGYPYYWYSSPLWYLPYGYGFGPRYRYGFGPRFGFSRGFVGTRSFGGATFHAGAIGHGEGRR
jgi:hypothetical protein